MQGLIGGQLQLFMPSTLEVVAMRSLVRLLAITSEARFAGLPDVATTSELGLPEINSLLWFAFLAPAKTPAEVVARLQAAFASAKDDAALKQRLTEAGFDMQIQDAAATLAYMRQEAARWGAVIKANDVRVGD